LSITDDVFRVLAGRGTMSIAEIRLAIGCGPESDVLRAVRFLRMKKKVKTSKVWNPPFVVWRVDEYFSGERVADAKDFQAASC